MNYIDSASSRARLFALIALLPGIAVGQTSTTTTTTTTKTEPIPVETTAPEESKTVVLSPYVVDATRDVGFVAASSLAGGRLATDLKDTPVAYSVLTREFIDALGLTDVAKALQWTTNATIATDDGRSTQFGNPGFSSLANFRGVRADQPQINYFPAYYDYDSYNLERFDFSRGPNSILFGSGSNGGTANALYKTARLDQTIRDVQIKLGSWEYYRASIDVNQPIGQTAAIRVNALWQDNDTWRSREFEKKKGASLHLAFEPWKKTRFEAVVDKGKVENNFGLTTLGDRISGWDGTTVYNGPIPGTAAPAGITGTQRNGNSTAPYWAFSPGQLGGAVVNWANTGTTVAGGQNGAGIGGTPVVGGTLNQDQNPLLEAQGLPSNFLGLAQSRSQWFLPGREFSPTFDGTAYSNDYFNSIVTATQQVGDHVFLSASGNFTSGYRDTNYTIVRGLNNIQLDLNQQLPGGGTNPNYLQAYLESPRDFDQVTSWAQNYRGNAAFVFDKTGFGNYRVNLELGQFNLNSTRSKYRYGIRDPLMDPRLWISNNLIRWRYYLNVPQRPMDPLGTASIYDPVAGTTRTVDTGYLLDTNRPTETVRTYNKFNYFQAAFNAQFWDERINLLGAVRRDDWSSNNKFTDYRMDLPTNYNGTDRIYKPTGDPATYYGLMYTPKNAAGVPTGSPQQAATRPRDAAGFGMPQYAADVFQDDFSPPTIEGTTDTFSVGGVVHVLPWASLFANYAETWAPPGSNLRIDYSVFVPVTSEGWDAGVRFNLLQEKVQVSVTRYGSTQENLSQSTGSGSAGLAISLPNAINAIITTNVIGDLSAGGVNARGLNIVPSSYVDVATRRTSGWEFEVVANPLKGWRVMANAAWADAEQGDGFADTRGYLITNNTTMKQILADAGATVGSDGRATVNPGVTTATSPDVLNAVNSWNQLVDAQANLTPAYQKVSRLAEVTANVFTDYTVQSGPLKDFRFGGGFNYRGREVIGFRGADTIVNPANPAAAIDDPSVDALTPVYRKGYTVATVALGYTTKICGYQTRFDLTLSNALDYDDVQFYNTAQRPPGGNVSSPARVATANQYYYIVPRSVTFSATVSF